MLVTERSPEGSGTKVVLFKVKDTKPEANHGLVGAYALCKVSTNCRLLGELVSLGQLSWTQ